MSEIVELLRQLVAIDSINPDLVPGGAGEEKIDKRTRCWLKNSGSLSGCSSLTARRNAANVPDSNPCLPP